MKQLPYILLYYVNRTKGGHVLKYYICDAFSFNMSDIVGWFVVLRIYVDLVILKQYLRLGNRR